MFEAREIYCDTGKMPKEMIWRWSEKRLSSILLAGTFLYLIIGICITYMGIWHCSTTDDDICF